MSKRDTIVEDRSARNHRSFDLSYKKLPATGVFPIKNVAANAFAFCGDGPACDGSVLFLERYDDACDHGDVQKLKSDNDLLAASDDAFFAYDAQSDP